jgi:phage replication O-like protein O
MSLPIPNYTQIPNVILDDYLAVMKPAELRVVLAIARQTFGWHRESEQLSIAELEAMTGMSRQGVLNGLNDAIESGIIERLDGLDNEDAIDIIQSKRPQQFPRAIAGKVCVWCQGTTIKLHKHHFPISRASGGEETISICPNCHVEFHTLVDGGYRLSPKFSLDAGSDQESEQ